MKYKETAKELTTYEERKEVWGSITMYEMGKIVKK